MADTEKKITFSATDNVSQKSNQIYQGIIGNAQKYNNALKEQVSFINQQIKALENKAKLEKSSNEAALKDLEKQTKAAAPGMVQQQLSKTLVSERQSRLGKEAESTEAVTLLKELVAETKKNASAAEKTEKAATKEQENRAKYIDRLDARKEALADPKGVKKRFSVAESTSYEGMSSSQIERLQYQNSVVSKNVEKPSSSTFKEVLIGMLAAGAVQHIAHTVANAQTGEQAVESLLDPFTLGQSSRTGEARFQSEVGLNRLKAISGNRGIGLQPNTELGYNAVETANMQVGLMGAAGTSSNLGRNTSQAQSLEKGLGLSQSTLVQIVRDARTIRSTADMTQIVSSVIKANPELKSDQTKLSEILQMRSSMLNTLAGQTENVNSNQVMGIMGALRGVGGNFADPNMGMKNMMNINQALTNPSNDFQKARSFSALNALSPGSSYFQLLEAKEKGIGQQGYLSAMLSQLKRETGGGENFALATMNNLGLGASTSRKLTEAFEKNPDMFSNFKGTNSDIEKIVGGERAGGLVSEREREKTAAEEADRLGIASGLIEKAAQTFHVASNEFQKGVGNLGEVFGMKKEGTAAGFEVTNAPLMAMWHLAFGTNGKKEH